ncbi:hypothetical protein GCM10027190_38900 [Spirosoma areae]
MEAYLLGLATEQEKEEVEQLLTTDADVLAQLSELETDMEEYFIRHAVPPPPGIREAIELRISETDIKKWEPAKQAGPEPRETRSRQPHYVNVEVDETHIRVHKNWRTAFIAVFILSKIFLILGLYFYFKANSLEQEITRLKTAPQQTAPLPRTQ